MASPHSFPGVGRRPRPADRLRRLVFNTVAVGAIAGAPLATVALWLLLTDPVLASDMGGGGLVYPVLRALLLAVGKVATALLALL